MTRIEIYNAILETFATLIPIAFMVMFMVAGD